MTNPLVWTLRRRIPLRLLSPIATLAIVAWAGTSAWAGNTTWNGNTSTDWNTASNWSAGVPGANDLAIIPSPLASGRYPVLNANGSAGQISVNAGGTVTVQNGVTLKLGGNTQPTIIGPGSILTVGTGFIEINQNGNGTFVSSTTGSITLGNLRLKNNGSGAQCQIPDGFTLNVNGDFEDQIGKLAVGDNTTHAPAKVFINGNASLYAQGDIDMTITPSCELHLRGNYSESGKRFESGQTSTVFWDGAGNQNIGSTDPQTGDSDYANLVVGGGARTVTFLQNPNTAYGFNVIKSLTVGPNVNFVVQEACNNAVNQGIGTTSGDVFRIDNGATVTFQQNFNPSCTITFADANGAPSTGTLRIQGTITADQSIFGWGLNAGNGTIVYAGQAVSQTVYTSTNTTTPVPLYYYNLTIDNTGAVATQQNGPLNVANTMTVGVAGGTAAVFTAVAQNISVGNDLIINKTFNAANQTIFVGDDFTANGTFNASTSTVFMTTTFDATGTISGTAASLTFNNLKSNRTTIAPPAPAPVASLLGVTGNVTPGDHSYKVTFVDLNNSESVPGLSSNVRTATASNGQIMVSVATDPALIAVKRRIYRTKAGNTGSWLFLKEIPDNTTGTYTDNSPDAALGAAAPAAADGGVVTAARSFTVNNAFQVINATLTTSGVMGTPITMTALQGMTVGDGQGAAGSARLLLLGPDTLAINSGKTLTITAADGLLSSRMNGTIPSVAAYPTLTRTGSGTFTTAVNGQIDVWGLNFSFGDKDGINIVTIAGNVKTFRNVNFAAQDSATLGGQAPADVTFSVPALDFDCPGCFFGTLITGGVNVRARSPAAWTSVQGMRLRFENRGTGSAPIVNGGGGGASATAGAGDLRDDDDDKSASFVSGYPLANNGVIDGGEPANGSIVQWVYTANIDLVGTTQGTPNSIDGLPMPAFDWNGLQYYAVYVPMKGNGTTTYDTIYVTNLNGDLLYSYSLSNFAEHIVGPIWWDSFFSGGHVVYFGTTAGKVYKLVDNGSSLGTAGGGWMLSNSSILDTVTSPVIVEGLNLYFGGSKGASSAIYRVPLSAPAIDTTVTASLTVKTSPAWTDDYVGATRVILLGGSSHIYRVKVNAWGAVTGDYAPGGAGDFVGWASITSLYNNPYNYLYLGDTNGTMYAVDPLQPTATFGVQRTGFPISTGSAIRASIALDFYGNRIFFGNDGGVVTTVDLAAVATSMSTPGNAMIRTTPAFWNGALYVTNVAGNLFVIDVARQLVFMTYNFGTVSPTAQSDISIDVGRGRVYVGTAAGKMYSFPLLTPLP